MCFLFILLGYRYGHIMFENTQVTRTIFCCIIIMLCLQNIMTIYVKLVTILEKIL